MPTARPIRAIRIWVFNRRFPGWAHILQLAGGGDGCKGKVTINDHGTMEYRQTKFSALLVENGEDFWIALYERLLASRCMPLAVNSARDGLRMLSLMAFDLVVCDYRLADADGIAFFGEAARVHAGGLNILVARRREIVSISDAIMAGIDDVAEKPLSLSVLIANLDKRLCLAGCSLPWVRSPAIHPRTPADPVHLAGSI